MLVVLHALSADFFSSKLTFLQICLGKTISVSNDLDPDHARLFVGRGLDCNCLQRLSADDKSPPEGKEFRACNIFYIFQK